MLVILMAKDIALQRQQHLRWLLAAGKSKCVVWQYFVSNHLKCREFPHLVITASTSQRVVERGGPSTSNRAALPYRLVHAATKE